jgi:NhaC family Na+:H+ antiporter
MDLLAAFALFAVSTISFLLSGYGMIWGILVGFMAFMLTGMHRRFLLKALLQMSWQGAKKSLIVIRVLLVIGILTALWRSAGTFAFFVVWGIRLITPHLFVIAAYILSCVLSYAIGTSFGVAGTLGIVLMTLARSCGVDEFVTAGAVMSGIYFGDRCSPASSCALLVASLTGTNLYDNIRLMLKTAFLPVAFCVVFYSWLSFRNPMSSGAVTIITDIEQNFSLSIWTMMPAVVMLVLPLFKVRPLYAFITSVVVAFFCTIFVQNMSIAETLKTSIFGYHADPGSVNALFNGGGLVSMLSMCLVLFVSGTYSGIFEGTKMLEKFQSKLFAFMEKYGAFAVSFFTSFFMNAVFCNQTIGILMSHQMLAALYKKSSRTGTELAQDIANSGVVTAGMIPWCIACSVPLSMMGVSAGAIPYSLYLYLLPLCYALTRKNWFKNQ